MLPAQRTKSHAVASHPWPIRVGMLLDWLMEPGPATTPRVDVAKFGIGFCPGCQRLRSAASASCLYCGDIRAVRAEDA